jgi:hypothetical protein
VGYSVEGPLQGSIPIMEVTMGGTPENVTLGGHVCPVGEPARGLPGDARDACVLARYLLHVAHDRWD